ncbi:MAG: XdhC family protein [Elusimicrobia bacterium]|nr:XdhC family protein [Elusimicrobiota bacterium]
MNENVTLLFCQAMESGRSAALATVIASEGSSPRDAGAKMKAAETVAGLRKKGCRADDPRVFSPIGLDLGGKSPGEIAVSVVAEILQARYGRPGGHLRLAPR